MRYCSILLMSAAAVLATRGRCEERVAESLGGGAAFSYELPAGWKSVQQPTEHFKMALAPDPDNPANTAVGATPYVVFREGQFIGELKDFAVKTSQSFQKAFPKYQELAIDQMQANDKTTIYRIVAQNEIRGTPVRLTTYLYAGPANLKLTMIFTAPTQISERFDGVLEHTAKSLTIEGGIIVSAVLNASLTAMDNAIAASVKTSDAFSKAPSDAEIQGKVIAPLLAGIKDMHLLEVKSEQEKAFQAGQFNDEANNKLCENMGKWLGNFKVDIPLSAQYVIAEQKAGRLKGADLEVGIRILKWATERLRGILQSTQQVKEKKE